jgi:uncharacterized protein (TIGR00369 family)
MPPGDESPPVSEQPEPRTVSVELPAGLAERFAAAADRAGSEEEALLADLAAEYAELSEAIETYTGRDQAGAGAVAGALAERPPPVGSLLGFEMADAGDGRAIMTLDAGPRHANPMGTLHGGVVCDVGDAAMGTAFATTLSEGESFTTLELDVKFRRPVWEAELTATAEVTDRGRRTGLVECDVTDGEDRLVARLDSVCMVLRGEAASGR